MSEMIGITSMARLRGKITDYSVFIYYWLPTTLYHRDLISSLDVVDTVPM